MTRSPILAEVERRALELSEGERLWLIERLAQSLRTGTLGLQPDWPLGLSAMAADPEVQRELQHIADEFAATERDGLGEA
jgi:hypothetical protein